MLRERYFTRETIAAKAGSMLRDISRAGMRRRGDAFRVEHAALLIVDMQHYFLQEQSHAFIPSAPAIRENILLLAEYFSMHNRPVIGTIHADRADSLMSQWWKDSIPRGSPLSRVDEEMEKVITIHIEKSGYDSFYETELQDILKRENTASLVITGVHTHLCCETTARVAFVRGFSVYFPVDATATYNETFHRAALVNLGHGFAHVVLTRDLLGA